MRRTQQFIQISRNTQCGSNNGPASNAGSPDALFGDSNQSEVLIFVVE